MESLTDRAQHRSEEVLHLRHRRSTAHHHFLVLLNNHLHQLRVDPDQPESSTPATLLRRLVLAPGTVRLMVPLSRPIL